MQRITVIGLGLMGSALARALIGAGYQVTVWNRTPDKAAPLAAEGAEVASSVQAAVEASPVTLICIRSHDDTRALLADVAPSLAGRTIVELSTGDGAEARGLFDWLGSQDARPLIGMIAVFPGDVGKPDSSVVAVGEEEAWNAAKGALRVLGGKSTYLGDNIAVLPALFAGLFLPRQAFMFGMIYGALICRKAGISMNDYVAQIPLTLKVVQDYFDIFAETVPSGRFDDPPASIGIYAAAFRDVVRTFETNGVRRELPTLLEELMDEGVAAGLSEKHVTALTGLMQS